MLFLCHGGTLKEDTVGESPLVQRGKVSSPGAECCGIVSVGLPVSAAVCSSRNKAMLMRHAGSLSTCERVGLVILSMSNRESGRYS